MSGPLSGLRVLDLSHYGVGPWACVLLGEMGADVVKVESPEGDYLSRNPPPYKNGITTVYLCSNLNKRIAQFDLNDEVVRETMYELVRQSDILVENHRPGFLDRRGLSYEAASKINPRLIYCSSSGYGSHGPYAQMGSVDGYGQSISGFVSVNGGVGEEPELMKGSSPADHGTSQYIVSGVLAALYNREVTGRGQFVDSSQMHAMVAVSGPRAVEYFATGVSPTPLGTGVATIVPSRAYKAADGRYVNISALDDTTWQRLCAALSLSSLAANPELWTNAGRVAHRAEVDAAIETVVATQPADHWARLLTSADVPAGLYLSFNNLRVTEQVHLKKMIEDVETPYGRITVGGMPWLFSRTPGEILGTHVPGADNEEILTVFAPKDTPPAAPALSLAPRRTNGPLEGLRVVDLTQGYSGFTGMTMADLGAEVIKVESPAGDYLRMQGPPFVGDTAVAFLGVNRSKLGVSLAWETDAPSRAALDQLIAGADVLITDYQPTAARERRLDYDTLAALHPRLVHCSLTPFGDSGPMADQPATELEMQGIGAQWRWLGRPGGEPVRLGVPYATLAAANFAFQGTMAALYERARSGQGQKVEVSILASSLAMESTMWASNSEPDQGGIGHDGHHLLPPTRGYPTRDGAIMWGFTRDQPAMTEFCRRLGLDEEFSRKEAWNAQLGRPVFRKAFADHDSDELVGWVRELGGTAVHIHTFASLGKDPQALAVGLVSEYDYPGVGRMATTGLGWEFPESPAKHGRPPLLGEHTHQVLGASGVPEAQIAGLEQAASKARESQ